MTGWLVGWIVFSSFATGFLICFLLGAALFAWAERNGVDTRGKR